MHLFWLSDEAWSAIEPHLPRGKPGKPRVDDRRVISGILYVLKRDAGGAIARLSTDHRRRFITATIDGQPGDFGKSSLPRWPQPGRCLKNYPSIAPM